MDETEAWVSKLNALARKLDEDASALHPSAWPEALKADTERWKQLAAEGPGKITAAQFVHDGLTSVLPPGVPLSGEIIQAKWTGKEKALGTLTMFDGQTGVVEVSKWTKRYEGAWCIAWQDTGNTPCHWTGSNWERVASVCLQITLDELDP